MDLNLDRKVVDHFLALLNRLGYHDRLAERSGPHFWRDRESAAIAWVIDLLTDEFEDEFREAQRIHKGQR